MLDYLPFHRLGFVRCYTPDGTFGGNDGSEVNNNVVATMIKVPTVKETTIFLKIS